MPPSGQTGTPVTVSGNIQLTPSSLPAGSTNIRYYVDGKEVGSQLDTTKLSEGKHTVEVKATDPNGKEISSKTDIIVKNKLTPLEQARAGLVKSVPYLIALGVLGVLGLSWWGLPRLGISRNPQHWFGGHSGGPATTSPSPQLPAGPQPGLIMPEAPESPSTPPTDPSKP